MLLGPARRSRYTDTGLVNKAQLIIIHKNRALEDSCPQDALSLCLSPFILSACIHLLYVLVHIVCLWAYNKFLIIYIALVNLKFPGEW